MEVLLLISVDGVDVEKILTVVEFWQWCAEPAVNEWEIVLCVSSFDLWGHVHRLRDSCHINNNLRLV